MFIDTLNKVTQNCMWNTPLRMIHNFAMKPKEEMANSKNLLLVMVRLIHVDPMLMLHVRSLNNGSIRHININSKMSIKI